MTGVVQMSSGDGAPEVLQVSTTSDPSVTVALDAVSVAMGSSVGTEGGNIQEVQTYVCVSEAPWTNTHNTHTHTNTNTQDRKSVV